MPSPPKTGKPFELQYLCKEIKQSRMAEHLGGNPAFEKESIIMQHGVFALLIGTLNNQIQMNHQSNPFDSHDVVMSVFLVTLFIYATASVAEVMLRARESTYYTLAGKLRLFASALAAILLLATLAPVLGCIISVVWASIFLGVAYESSQELYTILSQITNKLLDMLTRLIARVRSRKEEPNQSRV